MTRKKLLLYSGVCNVNPQRRLEALVETMKEALSESDIIITTGGTSMGAADLLKVNLYSLTQVGKEDN